MSTPSVSERPDGPDSPGNADIANWLTVATIIRDTGHCPNVEQLLRSACDELEYIDAEIVAKRLWPKKVMLLRAVAACLPHIEPLITTGEERQLFDEAEWAAIQCSLAAGTLYNVDMTPASMHFSVLQTARSGLLVSIEERAKTAAAFNACWQPLYKKSQDAYANWSPAADAAEPSQCATSDPSETAGDRLDEICDALTAAQRKMVRFLWLRKNPTNWDTLAEHCGTSPEPDAMKKALARLTARLLKNGIDDIHLENNEGTRRVKLIRQDK